MVHVYDIESVAGFAGQAPTKIAGLSEAPEKRAYSTRLSRFDGGELRVGMSGSMRQGISSAR